MIGVAAGENLSLGFQSPKSTRVDYAIAVTLKIIAIRMAGFRKTASAGLLHSHRIFGEHALSLAFQAPAFRRLLQVVPLRASRRGRRRYIIYSGNLPGPASSWRTQAFSAPGRRHSDPLPQPRSCSTRPAPAPNAPPRALNGRSSDRDLRGGPGRWDQYRSVAKPS